MATVTDEMLVSDNRLLDIHRAAGYLAISVDTVRSMIKKGAIPYIRLTAAAGKGILYRFRIGDLDEFILRHRTAANPKYYVATDHELPIAMVLRFVDLIEYSVRRYRCQRLIPDFSPESIRRYIELKYHAKMERDIRREQHAKTCTRLTKTISLLKYYRRKCKTLLCAKCGEPLMDQVKKS